MVKIKRFASFIKHWSLWINFAYYAVSFVYAFWKDVLQRVAWLFGFFFPYFSLVCIPKIIMIFLKSNKVLRIERRLFFCLKLTYVKSWTTKIWYTSNIGFCFFKIFSFK